MSKQAADEPEGQPHEPVEGMGGHNGEDGDKRQDRVQQCTHSGRRELSGRLPMALRRRADRGGIVGLGTRA